MKTNIKLKFPIPKEMADKILKAQAEREYQRPLWKLTKEEIDELEEKNRVIKKSRSEER